MFGRLAVSCAAAAQYVHVQGAASRGQRPLKKLRRSLEVVWLQAGAHFFFTCFM